MHINWSKALHGWQLVFLLLLSIHLTACATDGKKIVNHSFEFNALWDSPEVEILDYRYGSSQHPTARYRGTGAVKQSVGITGDMNLGDDIYVKWRHRETGEVFEQTVELKNRFPIEMTGQRVYFLIENDQLYVWLIALKKAREKVSTEELNRAKATAVTPRKRAMKRYILHNITQLYPDPITQVQ